jgi:uncharacterized iron-regulated membrane protein
MMRRLHAWIGLGAGLFILIQAVTGFLLLMRVPITVNEIHELRRDGRPPTPLADALAEVSRRLEDEPWSYIRFPRADSPAIEVGFNGGAKKLFDRHGVGPVGEGFAGEASVAHWLHEFHVRLTAGWTGETVNSAAGAGLLFLGISGLIVWWPYRRKTSPGGLVPRGVSRPKLLRWHWTVGLVVSLFVVLMSFTGIMISFHSVPHNLVMWLSGEDLGGRAMAAARGAPPKPGEIRAAATVRDWPAVIAAAEAVFPDDKLGLVSAPRTPEGPVTFRTHREGEWNPIGRSLIAIDPATAEVRATWNALEAGPMVRALMSMYPIHAGLTGFRYHSLILMLVALFIVILSITGFIAYLRRPRSVE